MIVGGGEMAAGLLRDLAKADPASIAVHHPASHDREPPAEVGKCVVFLINARAIAVFSGISAQVIRYAKNL